MASPGDTIANPESYAPVGSLVVLPTGEVKEMFEPNGSLRATIQDTVAPLFQYFLMNEQKTDITLTSDVVTGAEVIDVSSGHGFTGAAGEQILLFQNNYFTQLKVTGVATNAISVENPVQGPGFTVAGATVIRGNINMNVDGSSTPVDFRMQLRNFTIPIDISKIIITMQHKTNVPDDGKFGGLAPLTKGLFFKKEDGTSFSLGNYIENQAFKDTGGEVEYTTKAPAGTNGTNIVYDIKSAFGQVIRIRPSDNDAIVGMVRDNIDDTAGMAKMTASMIGSYTQGEA